MGLLIVRRPVIHYTINTLRMSVHDQILVKDGHRETEPNLK